MLEHFCTGTQQRAVAAHVLFKLLVLSVARVA